MKVILLESVAKLGQIGDSVEVKPGYARNYLIPQKMAIRSTPEAIAEVESRRAELLKEEKHRLDVATARADAAVKEFTISRRVIDEDGRLFGSVTANDIVELAAEQDTEILRSELIMPDNNIKNTGEFAIPVNIHPEVSFEIKLTVVADNLVPSLEETLAAADQVEADESGSADETDEESGSDAEPEDAESSAEKESSE